MHKIRNESVDRLFQSFLNLQSIEECYAYFEDLCTVKELLDMAQRLDTAIYLSEGYSYQRIMENMDISTATVTARLAAITVTVRIPRAINLIAFIHLFLSYSLTQPTP